MASSGTVKISECYANESVSVNRPLLQETTKAPGGFVGYGGGTVVIENSGFTGSVKAPGFRVAFAGQLLGHCYRKGQLYRVGR